MRDIAKVFATAAALFAGISAPPVQAQDAAVGDLSELAAWINRMPGGAPRLHVIGEITAPTPCYDVVAEFAGETAAIPSTYRLEVSLRPQDGICIQRVQALEFHFTADDYQGNANEVEVISGDRRETIPIEPVF